MLPLRTDDWDDWACESDWRDTQFSQRDTSLHFSTEPGFFRRRRDRITDKYETDALQALGWEPTL